MSRDGWAALPRGATGLSAVCDCGISWSDSLTICVAMRPNYICYMCVFVCLYSTLFPYGVMGWSETCYCGTTRLNSLDFRFTYGITLKLNFQPYIIQLFHACLVNSQNYAPRYRGQLNALKPEASRPRAIVHWAVHGTKVRGFYYSPNRHDITVLLPNRTK